MNHRDEITKQKRIAQEVLTALSVINPTCIVAGGAPRDWDHEIPANDIDVYIHYGLEGTGAHITSTLYRAFPSSRWIRQTGEGILEHYRRNPDLHAVYSGIVEDTIVQVCEMRTSTYHLLGSFPLSSSKIWFKDNRIHRDYEYQYYFKMNNIQIVKEEYWDDMNTNPYMLKMTDRYLPNEYLYLRRRDAMQELNQRRTGRAIPIPSWEPNGTRIDVDFSAPQPTPTLQSIRSDTVGGRVLRASDWDRGIDIF